MFSKIFKETSSRKEFYNIYIFGIFTICLIRQKSSQCKNIFLMYWSTTCREENILYVKTKILIVFSWGYREPNRLSTRNATRSEWIYSYKNMLHKQIVCWCWLVVIYVFSRWFDRFLIYYECLSSWSLIEKELHGWKTNKNISGSLFARNLFSPFFLSSVPRDRTPLSLLPAGSSCFYSFALLLSLILDLYELVGVLR